VDNNLTFGEKIRKLREDLDLSLRAVADKIGVSAAFLSDVELGRRFPKPDTLKLLAKELRVTSEELSKYDFRDEADNIKKMMFSNGAAGVAFRTVAEQMKKGVPPQEIVKRVENTRRG
jgi:transcriptional regulator with XRE-family HTH domain